MQDPALIGCSAQCESVQKRRNIKRKRKSLEPVVVVSIQWSFVFLFFLPLIYLISSLTFNFFFLTVFH